MASRGFTYTYDFTTDDGNWTLSDATISGGILDITATGGSAERSPDADWYSGSTNDFILELDWKIDTDVDRTILIFVWLVGDANNLYFDIRGSTFDVHRIVYADTLKASAAFNPVINTWYTARIRRVGTTYYFRATAALAEISWNLGTERALNYIRIELAQTTGDCDNFKYSWIKAVLSGAISFIGTTIRKPKKTFTGSISFTGILTRLPKIVLTGAITFIGTLQKLPKKLLTGAITFSGTLITKVKKTLTGAISFIGQIFNPYLDGIWSLFIKRTTTWTGQSKETTEWSEQSKEDTEWTVE